MKVIGVLLVALWVAGCQTAGPHKMSSIAASDDPAGRLVLVDEGKSVAPIVVFADAPPMIRNAVDELAAYIEKMSGAEPVVLEGTPDPLPDHAIWVGVQAPVRALFPEIDFEFTHAEEILVAANENHVVIAGRDRWDPEHLVVQGRDAIIEGKQSEYGTVNAVYTFLQDSLGVRWFWPGESGQDVLNMKTIALAPFTYRYHPQIRARAELFRLSALGDGRGHSHDWVRHQRLQLDSLNLPGGHAYTTWWDRYHETYPDIFAMQPNGKRDGFPGPGKVKLCQSNPKVWDLWRNDVEEQLKEHPYQQVFNGSPNDSWNRGQCICENCRAWDDPNGSPVMYHWEGLTQEYVSMSDRYVTFANHLAAKLKERFPTKDYYVKIGAYGGASRMAPIAAVPADNVSIASVHNFHLQSTATRAVAMAEFAAWGKVAPHIAWRPNLGNRAGYHCGLPDVAPSQAIEDIRFVAENGCIGLFYDTIWEHWSTQAPQFYILAQLAWNPWADGEAIVEDYYSRAFGPGAPEVKAYWKQMIELRNELVENPDLRLKDLPEVYTDQALDAAARLLDRAEESVGEDSIYRDRIALVRAGLDYTRYMRDIRVLMASMEARGSADPEGVAKVNLLWTEIRQLCSDHPLALNAGWIKPGARWMGAFDPDRLP